MSNKVRGSADDGIENVRQMALGLSDKFGERAAAVARLQVSAASGDAKATWARITRFLEG